MQMTFKDLFAEYGKEKVNILTKYPSILTMHGMGDRGRLTEELTTQFEPDELIFEREKLDGTNVRILLLSPTPYTVDYLVGSREALLHMMGDTLYDPALGIVDSLRQLRMLPQLGQLKPDGKTVLRVVYGELYGGTIGNGARHYGKGAAEFRIFDVADFTAGLLHEQLQRAPLAISKWREHESPGGLVYGQPFQPVARVKDLIGDSVFKGIPFRKSSRASDWLSLSHADVLAKLKATLPTTRCLTDGEATGQGEGLILANENRSRIVKVRFEDYEKTLRAATSPRS